jgi:hypothetical protein
VGYFERKSAFFTYVDFALVKIWHLWTQTFTPSIRNKRVHFASVEACRFRTLTHLLGRKFADRRCQWNSDGRINSCLFLEMTTARRCESRSRTESVADNDAVVTILTACDAWRRMRLVCFVACRHKKQQKLEVTLERKWILTECCF